MSGEVGVAFVSNDGTYEARSRNGDPSTVEPLATCAVRVSELAEMAGAIGGGRCHQIVIDVTGDLTLVVIPVGDGAQLAVVASGVDLERLAFESFRLVERLNQL